MTGFERTIPSFPRYTIVGNEETGEHHMRIENATLQDDAEYQCQVGPRGLSKPIRANAQLTVLSKSMIGTISRDGASDQVYQTITITCIKRYRV